MNQLTGIDLIELRVELNDTSETAFTEPKSGPSELTQATLGFWRYKAIMGE